MKSMFGSKRKAKKIQVDEDDEVQVEEPSAPEPEVISATPPPPAFYELLLKRKTTEPAFNGKKAYKKSSLRQSMNFDDGESGANETLRSSDQTAATMKDDEDRFKRPSIERSASLHKKKKPTKSRLSFGPGEIISGDAAEALEDNELFTPKKTTYGKRMVEASAPRQSLPGYKIPIRTGDEDEERPKYSKDYLNELKSSTPTTPKDLYTDIMATVDDDEGLDEAELEGAMIVDTADTPQIIPTEAEIREKKERRARLAKEEDFISLNDTGDSRLSLLPSSKKAETRLVREDEDIAEGFDEFVDDGRISLGKKAEREAKRRQKAEIRNMIAAAEGSSSEESDDSEAERRAAYEVAQTRAGMDGLSRPDQTAASQVPPKITPIPNLSECLQRLQTTLNGMELELRKRNAKMVELQQEKSEIQAREGEVQRLLKEAGDRYSAMRAESGLPAVDPNTLSSSGPAALNPMLEMTRGLESFGNTPVGRQQVEDVG